MYRRGQKLLKRYEVPIGQPIALDISLRSPGPLKLSDRQIFEVKESIRAIKRMAPLCNVIFCKDLSSYTFEEAGSLSICGLMAYSEFFDNGDYTEPTILLSVQALTPGAIRSSANHESYHACESLLKESERDVLFRWGEFINSIDPPSFVAERKEQIWWSKNYERVAWSFENFCYLMAEDWKDDWLFLSRGFHDCIYFFPDEVYSVFRRIWSGQVGRRLPEDTLFPARSAGCVDRPAR